MSEDLSRSTKSRAVFVMALPRSGSSCLAGSLHRMGVDMGEGHWQPMDTLNPKGYYEDLRWQRVNKMLAGLRYNVRRVYSMPERHKGIYRSLFEMCSKQPIWGVKAPRMAFTFQHVHPLAEGICELRVILLERDLDAVVASMQRHSEVAYEGAYQMSDFRASRLIHKWDKALRMGLDTFDGPTHRAHYDDLIEQPADTLQGVAGFCFEGLTMPDLTEAIKWIDPSLRHHLPS